MPHTTKLAPTGQNHFIDFGCYRRGESHSPCFYIHTELYRDFVHGYQRYALYKSFRQGDMSGSGILETCVSTPKLISFRVTLKSVSKRSMIENTPRKGVILSDFIRIFAILDSVSVKKIVFFATLRQVIF